MSRLSRKLDRIFRNRCVPVCGHRAGNFGLGLAPLQAQIRPQNRRFPTGSLKVCRGPFSSAEYVYSLSRLLVWAAQLPDWRVVPEHSDAPRWVPTLCYTIVLPGRKSAFRAGFGPDCDRENTEALKWDCLNYPVGLLTLMRICCGPSCPDRSQNASRHVASPHFGMHFGDSKRRFLLRASPL